MKFEPIIEPSKALYRFGSDDKEQVFKKAITTRLVEILNQVANTTPSTFGYLGCAILADTSSGVPMPEVWLEFEFDKATYAKKSGYSNHEDYFPREELKALEGYFYIGDIMNIATTAVHNLPVLTGKGKLIDTRKDVGILRLKADLLLTILTVLDISAQDPNLTIRYKYSQGAYIGEFIDPAIVMDKYLPIDIAVTTSINFEEGYDPVKAKEVLEVNPEHLALHYVGSQNEPKQVHEDDEGKGCA